MRQIQDGLVAIATQIAIIAILVAGSTDGMRW
jgi:hypothetical protein